MNLQHSATCSGFLKNYPQAESRRLHIYTEWPNKMYTQFDMKNITL
jgi:hypothetical protein